MTFSGNTAVGGDGSVGGEAFGGALAANPTIVLLANSTFVGNEARGGAGSALSGGGAGGGGARIGANVGSGELAHLVFSGNRAVAGVGPGGQGYSIGGGLDASYAWNSITGSILFGNEAADGADCRSNGMVSDGYNMVGTANGCSWGPSDQVGVDPLLASLAHNGCVNPLPDGRCVPTTALDLGSPALDQGSCTVSGVSVDARGVPRPQDASGVADADDGCDIGAYEVAETDASLAVGESVDPLAVVEGSGAMSYTVTLSNDGSEGLTGLAVDVALVLPTGVNLVEATPSVGTWDGSVWSVAALTGGAAATLQLDLEADASAESGSEVISCDATLVSVDQSQILTGNDAAAESTSIYVPPPEIFASGFEVGDPEWSATVGGA